MPKSLFIHDPDDSSISLAYNKQQLKIATSGTTVSSVLTTARDLNPGISRYQGFSGYSEKGSDVAGHAGTPLVRIGTTNAFSQPVFEGHVLFGGLTSSGGPLPPAGSTVTGVRLELYNTIPTPAHSASVNVMAPDGVWNQTGKSFGALSPNHAWPVFVYDSLSTLLSQTVDPATTSYDTGTDDDFSNGDARVFRGSDDSVWGLYSRCIMNKTAGVAWTLDNMTVSARRSTVPQDFGTAECWLEVYGPTVETFSADSRWRIGDATNKLAESDRLLINDISEVHAGLTNFTFSGANRITLTPNQEIVVAFNHDDYDRDLEGLTNRRWYEVGAPTDLEMSGSWNPNQQLGLGGDLAPEKGWGSDRFATNADGTAFFFGLWLQGSSVTGNVSCPSKSTGWYSIADGTLNGDAKYNGELVAKVQAYIDDAAYDPDAGIHLAYRVVDSVFDSLLVENTGAGPNGGPKLRITYEPPAVP